MRKKRLLILISAIISLILMALSDVMRFFGLLLADLFPVHMQGWVSQYAPWIGMTTLLIFLLIPIIPVVLKVARKSTQPSRSSVFAEEPPPALERVIPLQGETERLPSPETDVENERIATDPPEKDPSSESEVVPEDEDSSEKETYEILFLKEDEEVPPDEDESIVQSTDSDVPADEEESQESDSNEESADEKRSDETGAEDPKEQVLPVDAEGSDQDAQPGKSPIFTEEPPPALERVIPLQGETERLPSPETDVENEHVPIDPSEKDSSLESEVAPEDEDSSEKETYEILFLKEDEEVPPDEDESTVQLTDSDVPADEEESQKSDSNEESADEKRSDETGAEDPKEQVLPVDAEGSDQDAQGSTSDREESAKEILPEPTEPTELKAPLPLSLSLEEVELEHDRVRLVVKANYVLAQDLFIGVREQAKDGDGTESVSRSVIINRGQSESGIFSVSRNFGSSSVVSIIPHADYRIDLPTFINSIGRWVLSQSDPVFRKYHLIPEKSELTIT